MARKPRQPLPRSKRCPHCDGLFTVHGLRGHIQFAHAGLAAAPAVPDTPPAAESASGAPAESEAAVEQVAAPAIEPDAAAVLLEPEPEPKAPAETPPSVTAADQRDHERMAEGLVRRVDRVLHEAVGTRRESDAELSDVASGVKPLAATLGRRAPFVFMLVTGLLVLALWAFEKYLGVRRRALPAESNAPPQQGVA